MLNFSQLPYFQKITLPFLLSVFILGCSSSKTERTIPKEIIITGEVETRNPKQRLSLSNQFGRSLAIVNDKKIQFKLEENKASTLTLSIKYFNISNICKAG